MGERRPFTAAVAVVAEWVGEEIRRVPPAAYAGDRVGTQCAAVWLRWWWSCHVLRPLDQRLQGVQWFGEVPERVRAMQTHRSRCVRCGEYATKRYGHYFQCDDCDVSDVERAVGAHRPTPDKAAETWSFQVELLQRRATDAERERDEAWAEVERLRQRVANLTQAPRQLAHRAGCPDLQEGDDDE